MKEKLSTITRVTFYLFFILLILAQFRLFYHSFMTLILVIGVFSLTIVYFFNDHTLYRKKHLFLLVTYLIITGIVLLLSHIHYQNFTSLVPGNFRYQLFSEILYFLKMSMPVFLLLVFSNLDIQKKNYDYVLLGTTFFVSVVIIFTNLFGVSYGSYSDEVIKGNFFTWFTDGYEKYTFYHLASKGFFNSANQVSAILLLILPFNVYSFIKKTDWKLFLLLLIQIWAMFLLGTKVAVIGSILVIFVLILMGMFYTFVKKEIIFSKGHILYFNFLFLSIAILFCYAPIHSRNEVQENIDQENDLVYLTIQQQDDALSPLETGQVKLSKEEKIKYIEQNYEAKRIHKKFILESYPYIYDPDFWYSILELTPDLRTDYRFLEEKMLQRVIEINHNNYDKWFGISYTRVQNIFNLEQDFKVQYYSVGIVGTILFLSCYFIMITKISYGIIKARLNHCFLPLALLCGGSVFLAVAFYGGNLLNSLMVTPFLCLILGYAKREMEEEINEKMDLD